MTDKLEVYRTSDGYRWRKIAPNGEIVSQGEAYTRPEDAIRGARRANPEIDTVEVTGLPAGQFVDVQDEPQP